MRTGITKVFIYSIFHVILVTGCQTPGMDRRQERREERREARQERREDRREQRRERWEKEEDR